MKPAATRCLAKWRKRLPFHDAILATPNQILPITAPAASLLPPIALMIA